jgi:cbb3-type cytochrome oxidase cytochrome c subunit
MKGLATLVLGIFGTFGFSWLGLILVPNFQIGHLNPQMDEEGTDVYPAPRSGMAERGRRVYVANGCYYCHTQQVRAYYAAADIDRKWGDRRSAPRDYIFDRPVLLGKERMGPDLANIGKRAPAEGEAPTAANAPMTAPSSGASPAPPAASPAQSPGAPAPSPPASPAQSPSSANAPPASSPAQPAAAPPGQSSPSQSAGSPTAQAAANAPPTAATSANPVTGEPPPYSAAWHHRHLYAPRSITIDSNMPAFRFLYEKRHISGQPSADALQLTGENAPPEGWEIVPTYDAQCLVAYLMSLDQSHPLKEVKTPGGAPAPAAGAPPAAPPAGSPPAAAPPKK